MSWLFSQALVEEYSGDTCLDGEPSVQLNGNPIQQAYCAPDRMTKFSRLSRFGMTFKPLTEDRGAELLTSYLAAFHAKTSAPQERGQESTESDPGCGHIWQELLARYDQVRLCGELPNPHFSGITQSSRRLGRVGVQCKMGCHIGGRRWCPPPARQNLDCCQLH